jgi:hypothetical protein
MKQTGTKLCIRSSLLWEPISLRVTKATTCDAVSSHIRQAMIQSLVPKLYFVHHVMLFVAVHSPISDYCSITFSVTTEFLGDDRDNIRVCVFHSLAFYCKTLSLVFSTNFVLFSSIIGYFIICFTFLWSYIFWNLHDFSTWSMILANYH